MAPKSEPPRPTNATLAPFHKCTLNPASPSTNRIAETWTLSIAKNPSISSQSPEAVTFAVNPVIWIVRTKLIGIAKATALPAMFVPVDPTASSNAIRPVVIKIATARNAGRPRHSTIRSPLGDDAWEPSTFTKLSSCDSTDMTHSTTHPNPLRRQRRFALDLHPYSTCTWTELRYPNGDRGKPGTRYASRLGTEHPPHHQASTKQRPTQPRPGCTTSHHSGGGPPMPAQAWSHPRHMRPRSGRHTLRKGLPVGLSR